MIATRLLHTLISLSLVGTPAFAQNLSLGAKAPQAEANSSVDYAVKCFDDANDLAKLLQHYVGAYSEYQTEGAIKSEPALQCSAAVVSLIIDRTLGKNYLDSLKAVESLSRSHPDAILDLANGLQMAWETKHALTFYTQTLGRADSMKRTGSGGLGLGFMIPILFNFQPKLKMAWTSLSQIGRFGSASQAFELGSPIVTGAASIAYTDGSIQRAIRVPPAPAMVLTLAKPQVASDLSESERKELRRFLIAGTASTVAVTLLTRALGASRVPWLQATALTLALGYGVEAGLSDQQKELDDFLEITNRDAKLREDILRFVSTRDKWLAVVNTMGFTEACQKRNFLRRAFLQAGQSLIASVLAVDAFRNREFVKAQVIQAVQTGMAPTEKLTPHKLEKRLAEINQDFAKATAQFVKNLKTFDASQEMSQHIAARELAKIQKDDVRDFIAHAPSPVQKASQDLLTDIRKMSKNSTPLGQRWPEAQDQLRDFDTKVLLRAASQISERAAKDRVQPGSTETLLFETYALITTGEDQMLNTLAQNALEDRAIKYYLLKGTTP